jgi:outer membrane lipoprotein SlyB
MTAIVLRKNACLKPCRKAVMAISLSLLAGTVMAQAGSVYDRNQTQVWGTVLEGTVLQVEVRQVESSWQSRGVGASVGSVLGYALASQHSNAGAATVLGTTLGGLVGERIANQAAMTEAQEIVLRLNKPHNGMDVITVVQPAPFSAVAPGDQILVTQSAGKTRVIKRNF